MLSLPRPVFIEEEAPEGHIRAVEDALREAGVDSTVEAAYGRRSAGVLPWAINIALAAPIASFFVALGAEAGKDAYHSLKQFVSSLRAARADAGDGSGQIDINDPEFTHVIFPSQDLPDEAFRSLLELDWSRMRGGWLVWRDGEWLNAAPRRDVPS